MAIRRKLTGPQTILGAGVEIMETSDKAVKSRSPNLLAKRALVFGAGGSLGPAIAKEFAAQGAEVYLSGRTRSKLETVAEDIKASGGRAHVAELDALDEVAVDAYFDGIVRETGRIDIVFHAIGARAHAFGSGSMPSR